MKTPSFWYQSAAWSSKILTPASYLYNTARRKNFNATQKSIACPVLSVGNVTAGGTGKTPICIMLVNLIKQAQIALTPYIITRGHGGLIKDAELIIDTTPAYLAGDEALLLTPHAPTIVSKNRFKGAEYALNLGADMIILDDGLQNKNLKPTLSFCVIDGQHGFGNRKLIPAGPLREPLSEASKRIDAFIIIGNDEQNVRSSLPVTHPCFTARLIAHTDNINKDLNYIGFCGIGLPQKFFKTLEDHNINIIDSEIFADHYPYTQMDIIRLINKAKDNNAHLITTTKDFIKIKSLIDDTSLFKTLPISIEPDDRSALIDFIKMRLQS